MRERAAGHTPPRTGPAPQAAGLTPPRAGRRPPAPCRRAPASCRRAQPPQGRDLLAARGVQRITVVLRPRMASSRGKLAHDLESGAIDQLQELPAGRSEEHTSELQSRGHLVCRLLLEKKQEIS